MTEYNIAGHQFGVPLDDVWIHFRYAENFSQGYFFQYNPGEPMPGTTSPLWVIILSIPFLFSQSLIIPFALFISSLFFLYALLELFELCVKLGLDLDQSMLITLLTMLAGRLMWSSLSGMEITSFVFLSILVFKNHVKEIEKEKVLISTGLLLGLASVIRPEAYLLALIYFLITIVFIVKQKTLPQIHLVPISRDRETLRRQGKNYSRLVLSLFVFLIIVLPYPLFCYTATGKFLPNTYEGQVTEMNYLPNFQFLLETGKLFVKENIAVVLLWLVAVFYFVINAVKGKADKKLLLINLWVILLPAVSSVIAPNWRHHGRYLIPLIPFINIVSVILFQKICSYIACKGVKKAALYRKIGLAVLLIFSVNSTIVFAGALGWNVDNINSQHVKIGKWLRDTLPGEKAFGMNDIGAIAFVTKKYVVDMAGLVTPEVFRFQKMSYREGANALLRLLKDKGVNYIIIYPDWFEYIMENYINSFTMVYSAKLEKNTICGEIEMFVYKVNWDKIELK